MPTSVTDVTSSRPTEVVDPDTRFGFAPLSYKYRDYAVNGEMLQDKATGEIFIKRPNDGKVVSYFQNKRYLYEQVTELNTILSSNTDYVFNRTNKSGMYSFVDYDLATITMDTPLDIIEHDMRFGSGDIYGLEFPVSVDTNKFICRLTTRDTDKPAIEYITGLYDGVLDGYNGSNVLLQQESEMFRTYPKWIYDNALITFSVTVTKDDIERRYTVTDSVRLNDASCVDIGRAQIDVDFPDGYDSCLVHMISIEYRKLHFVLQHPELFGDPNVIMANFRDMCYPDGVLYNYYCGIGVFTDDISEVKTNPKNGTLICLMDIVFTLRYISKIKGAVQGGSILLRNDEPLDDEWFPGSIWAEYCRDVKEHGEMIIHPTATTFRDLEIYYSTDTRLNVSLTTDPNDVDDILVIMNA